jgi:type III restriction enzyme
MLTLKPYQQDALDTLADYFHLVHAYGAKRGFIIRTDRPYHSVAQLPDLPYVCLRIPTGGGKTLVACHAVGVIQREFLQQDRSLVLWLTPTDTIRTQTLAALRNRDHPYRQALDGAVRGPIQVLELAEAFAISRAALDAATTIIVSTMAAVRVEDTEGRRIYEQNGALMPHFDDLPAAAVRRLEKYENGAAIPSLANLLCLRRPAVIVDEAHGARTDLSFEALARFNPACILELTATPTQPPKPNPSNVLYHVSAYELKAQHMIKLPIRLELRGLWREAIAAAVAKRNELQALADAERTLTGEYLRPIVLLQAQPKSKHGATLTVAAVRAALHDLGVPDDQIAEETGEVREVKAWEEKHGRTLFDERCPICFIITVQALREGWDCPFAYILCSVAELGTSTAVEQILGRVLRMPKATQKKHDDLNHAYAFVTSQRFGQVAATVEGLTQALEANGFTRFEAQQEIETYGTPVLPGFDGPLFGGMVAERPKTPAERAEKLSVPQLALWRDGELLVVEPDDFLEGGWTLRGCDAALTEADFPSRAGVDRSLEVDVNQAGQLTTHWLSDLHQQLSLLARDETMSADALVRWLDDNISHGQISQEDMQLYLLDVIERLRSERSFTLDQLSAERYRLRDAIIKRIGDCKRQAKAAGYQIALFSPHALVEVGPQRLFAFDPNYYPVNSFYEGPFAFTNHYYRAVGAMNGEEARCAGLIDTLPGVERWVRNPDRPPQAYWLPTPSDKFYPDFVALLKDGRTLVVEYKGSQLLGGPDTRQKEAVGKLWEARSGGTCVFRLVSAEDYEAQLRAVADR